MVFCSAGRSVALDSPGPCWAASGCAASFEWSSLSVSASGIAEVAVKPWSMPALVATFS